MKKVSAESIRQKILNKSRLEKRPFAELLQYYVMERFLYRLSQSTYVNQFILKGALMLRVWGTSEFRPTKDIDMLGIVSNSEASIKNVIGRIITIEEDDGLEFDVDSISTELITKDSDYQGIRVLFNALLTTAIVTVQIDIGFGDQVYPKSKKESLPTVLSLPAPIIYCYSRESSIAEKFDAMISLGTLNSRMKDFYDIWLLSNQFDFEGMNLKKAVSDTFSQRHTKIVLEPISFSSEFIELKQVQWKAFRKRMSMVSMPDEFHEIVEGVKVFLSPVAKAIITKSNFSLIWKNGIGWH